MRTVHCNYTDKDVKETDAIYLLKYNAYVSRRVYKKLSRNQLNDFFTKGQKVDLKTIKKIEQVETESVELKKGNNVQVISGLKKGKTGRLVDRLLYFQAYWQVTDGAGMFLVHKNDLNILTR